MPTSQDTRRAQREIRSAERVIYVCIEADYPDTQEIVNDLLVSYGDTL